MVAGLGHWLLSRLGWADGLIYAECAHRSLCCEKQGAHSGFVGRVCAYRAQPSTPLNARTKRGTWKHFRMAKWDTSTHYERVPSWYNARVTDAKLRHYRNIFIWYTSIPVAVSPRSPSASPPLCLSRSLSVFISHTLVFKYNNIWLC